MIFVLLVKSTQNRFWLIERKRQDNHFRKQLFSAERKKDKENKYATWRWMEDGGQSHGAGSLARIKEYLLNRGVRVFLKKFDSF